MNIQPVARLLLSAVAAISATLLLAINLGWQPSWMRSAKPAAVTDVNCANLQQGCTFKLGEHAYRLASDGPISGSHPVQLHIDGPARAIHASWQMAGMAMGPNRYALQAAGTGQWQASTLLPLCAQGRHDWLLLLQIDDQSVQIRTVQQ